MIERDRMLRLMVFMRYVRKTDHCWFWSGAVNSGRYGINSMDGVSALAHRTGWTLMRGPIPKGLVLRHTCDNPRCVNPNHLQPGTVLENVRDAWDRGRYPSRTGIANGRAKLTPDKVLSIRSDKTSSDRELADLHGVTDVAIRMARKRKTWAHI